jgi:hypothetical protein
MYRHAISITSGFQSTEKRAKEPEDGGGTGVVLKRDSVFNRILAESWMDVMVPTCPFEAIRALSSSGSLLNSGSISRYKAATPATCGAAMEVPDKVILAESSVYHAEVILARGKARSIRQANRSGIS